MDFYKILQEIMDERNLSIPDVARACGLTDSTVRSIFDRQQKKIALNIAFKLSKGLRVPLSRLNGEADNNTGSPSLAETLSLSGIEPMPKLVKKPLLGTIACGEPILAVENIDDYLLVPDAIHCDFLLRCKGDSMIGARILDGDIVCIRQQSDVDDGEIAAVLIDDEVTLKRVYKLPGRVQLRAENPTFPPIDVFEADNKEVRIIGKAVFFISAIK